MENCRHNIPWQGGIFLLPAFGDAGGPGHTEYSEAQELRQKSATLRVEVPGLIIPVLKQFFVTRAFILKVRF